MFRENQAFSGFSVDDLGTAESFYQNVLGMNVTRLPMGVLDLEIANGTHVLVYPKGSAHTPATFTVLNFPVKDIKATVGELTKRGVKFERYDMPDLKTDENGIAWGNGRGPNIAWFKDPAGNILAVLEQ